MKSKRNYRQLYTTLPAVLTGAVLAYKYFRKPSTDSTQAPTPKHTPNIEWISADPNAGSSGEVTEPLPMFYVGDIVNKYDPHLGALYYEQEGEGPTYYEIKDVRYDEEDEVHRYILEDDEFSWISEDWISLPMSTKYAKQYEDVEPFNIGNMEVPTQELIDAGNRVISKWLDDQARQGNIDRLLDVMNGDEATEEEKAEAKRVLTELTTKEVSE